MAEFDPDAFLAQKPEKKKSGFDPDAFLAKTAPPETAAQSFGRGAASLADTALNAVTGTLDVAAYPFARAYYGMTGNRTPEQAAALAQAATTSPKDVVGRLAGVTGTPGYEQAPLRALGTWAGETIGENIVQPAAQVTGIPESDVSSMLNSLAMGVAPVAGRTTAATGRAVAAAPRAVADVAGGFTGAITGKTAKPGVIPEPWQQPSVRQPVSDKYYTPAQLEQWRAGELPTEQLTAQPIQNLGPEAMSALARTQGNVPYAGQGFRAFGEQLGETYRNPLNLLTDVGLDVLTGGGLPTLGRLGYKGYQGIQGARAAKTLEGAGFSPLFPEEFAALERGQPHPSAIGPVPTRTATAAGPVAPVDLPRLTYNPTPETIYVAPEGVAGTDMRAVNQAGINLKYPEVKVGPVAPDTAAIAAKQAADDAASQASKQRILDMIRAKEGKPTGPVAPVAEAQPQPVVDTKPVAPTQVVETAPVAERVYTAAEVRRMLPRMAGESAEAFEARVQAVLAAQPKVETPPVITTEPTTKRKYTRQEDTIKELEAALSPEEKAAQAATVERQLAKTRGTQVQGPVAPTELPATSVESLKQKIKQPEKDPAMEEALRQRLEALKNKNKPAGTMEMITNDPDNVNAIKNKPWLDREAFEREEFMHNLGANPNDKFVAKMRSPEGSIIRAVDETADSTAYQFPDKTSVLISKSKKDGITSVTTYEGDVVRKYIVDDADGSIGGIAITKGDRTMATYDPVEGWMITADTPDGAYRTIFKSDAAAKEPANKKTFKNLEKTDWVEVVNQVWTRTQELKKGK